MSNKKTVEKPNVVEVEIIPQVVMVHGQKIKALEILEDYENGEIVHVVVKGIDGCTYEGQRIEQGKLVQ